MKLNFGKLPPGGRIRSRPATLILPLLVLLLSAGGTPGREKNPVIRGRIMDGTNGTPTRLRNLSLFVLEDEKKLIARIEAVGPRFSFSLPNRKVAPLLLQGEFQRHTFSHQLTTAEQKGEHEILFMVYDSVPLGAEVPLLSTRYIIRGRKGLRVAKVYLLVNNSRPPRVYRADALRIFIPPKARNIRGLLEAGRGGLALPVKLISSAENRYVPDCGFPPGEATLTVEFEIPDYRFRDRLLKRDGAMMRSGDEFPVLAWLRPENASVAIEGARHEPLDDRKTGDGLRIYYPYESDVIYEVTGANPAARNGPARNPLLAGPGTVLPLLASVTFLFVAFTIIALIAMHERKRGRISPPPS